MKGTNRSSFHDPLLQRYYHQEFPQTLEDGLPVISKWLRTMVILSPLSMAGLLPFQVANLWLINGGDPNHLHPLG